MSELAARVEALAWVKSAVVRLDLPGKMVVEVIEREPIAMVQADELFLMDGEGRLFARVGDERPQGLLLVSGFSGAGLHEGSFLSSEALDAFRELYSALDGVKGWLPRSAITECRWATGSGFTLISPQMAVPVQLGFEDYELRLNRLHKINSVLQERQWLGVVTRIDLDYSNKVYIEGQFTVPKGS
jgi:cell division septal protein FtsQ